MRIFFKFGLQKNENAANLGDRCSLFALMAVVPGYVVVVVVYLYLTSAKCTGIAAFSLWPEATALTEMVKVELHERKKMKFYNV